MEQLIKQNFIIFILFILLVSCESKQNKQGFTSSDTTLIVQDSLNSPQLDLIAYPEEFLAAFELVEWEGFKKLHQSMERLKELNFEGIEVDLIALSSYIKNLRSDPLPRKLEIPQIKSRLKVLEMQVTKARYFTRHYKSDSLVPALDLLYKHYNSFVLRMIALENENQEFISEEIPETVEE